MKSSPCSPRVTSFGSRYRLAIACAAALGTLALPAPDSVAAPKVIVISLDGATPRLVDQYSASGALPPNVGLRLLEAKGVKARQNLTINPSLTAAAHIAIATGSDAATNDVVANSFRLLGTPNTSGFTISGFGAPIGGYSIDGGPGGVPAMSPMLTALPIWATLRAAGKTVVTATWPGGDGVNVTVPGRPGAPGSATNPIVQPAAERTVNFTVPFGAASAPFQRGFALTAANFTDAPALTGAQLTAAGKTYFGTIKQANLETFAAGGQNYDIKLAAYDSDNNASYDSLVFFNAAQGIQPGPFALPSTGPAYVKPGEKLSALFSLENHSNKAGTRYFCTQLAPDLSTVRVARTSMTFIPRNPAVLADVDDINNHVGFWQPQPDFRIVERIDATPSTFATFSDLELEAIYMELVREFTKYQRDVLLRGISKAPDADLVMGYFEQPDGSGHQWFLVDPRQPTDFTNPNSIGAGQDLVKKARYHSYLQTAYQVANQAIQDVISSVGVDASGKPKSNIFVISDHGFEPFHTAVQVAPILTAAGIDTSNLRIVTSGPAANIYINLEGRPFGSAGVTREQFVALQQQIVAALRNFSDGNATYTLGAGSAPVFETVYARPLPADLNDPTFGRRTGEFIGQDSGDVFGLLTPGYNFDGRQNPVVTRQGDSANTIFSVPNFYGAHGYDPLHPNMSAIFYAAGPNISYHPRPLPIVANMDVTPTVLRILGMAPAATVQGRALRLGPAVNTLLKAASRKTHGEAGALEIVLPLAGGGIESREGDETGSRHGRDDDNREDHKNSARRDKGEHQLIFTFSNPLFRGRAEVTRGKGKVSKVDLKSAEMIVHLDGVRDAQELTIALTGVTDGATSINATINVGFLIGDLTGDRTVDATDVAEARSLGLGAPAASKSNASADVNVSGRLTERDAALVLDRVGNSIP